MLKSKLSRMVTMSGHFQKIALIVWVMMLVLDTGQGKSPTTVCHFYDKNECEENPNNCSYTTQNCTSMEDPEMPVKLWYCYVVWNHTAGVDVVLKGCWLDNSADPTLSQCYNRTECTSEDPNEKDVLFCCCQGNNCNVNFNHMPPAYVEEDEPDADPESRPMYNEKSQLLRTLMYSLVPIFGISQVIIILFWFYRRHRMTSHVPLPTTDPSPTGTPPSPMLDMLRPLQLLEIKARGRFGCVWKAQMGGELVAVKIFPQQDRNSWAAERDIYMLPQFNSHDNVLRFMGAERRGDNLNMELWLITEFHERGSLYDFLKGNLINWGELLKIAEGMSSGLAFLHEDLPASKIEANKPAIAHRDFKSKNVLLKADLTACVADFGLALKFEPGQNVGDAHGQVGTRRYMAPEVLEGAINFNLDAFLRIDMYACGLVMWELLTRCSAADGPVEEYMLPFEDEIGLHPTLEDMQDVVVQKKQRPTIKDQWLTNEGFMNLLDTIEECWDHDPEARLSAGCVAERLSQVLLLSLPCTTSNLVQVALTNEQTPPKESSI